MLCSAQNVDARVALKKAQIVSPLRVRSTDLTAMCAQYPILRDYHSWEREHGSKQLDDIVEGTRHCPRQF